MNISKTQYSIIFFFLSVSFIFIFFSFVNLRWSNNHAQNFGVIAIDLVRCILILVSVLLNYIIPKKRERYLPLIFTVLIFILTILSCDFKKEMDYIKTFQVLNASYIFIEASFLLLANSFSMKTEDKTAEKMAEYENIIKKYEAEKLQYDIELKKYETEKLQYDSKLKEYEKEKLEYKETAKLFISQNKEMANLLYLFDACHFSQGHDFYKIFFDEENIRFSLKKINKNDSNKGDNLNLKLSQLC